MMKNRGFTLIELVVVLVLVGILAATALPRFLDMSDDARIAANRGVAGAFKSGLNLATSGHNMQAAGARNYVFGRSNYTLSFPSDGNGMLDWPNYAYAPNETTAETDQTINPVGCANLFNAFINGSRAIPLTQELTQLLDEPQETIEQAAAQLEAEGNNYLAGIVGQGTTCIYLKVDAIPTLTLDLDLWTSNTNDASWGFLYFPQNGSVSVTLNEFANHGGPLISNPFASGSGGEGGGGDEGVDN